MESSSDTIQFKANFMWWQSIYFTNYIITSVNKTTQFFFEEINTLLLSMPKQHKKKSYFGTNSFISISKNFQDENQNQTFNPFFTNLDSTWTTTSQQLTDYCKLRHFLKLHLLQEMNSREVSKVFILIISWINTQHLLFLFIHNLSWPTFHPEVDNGMPYLCNLFLSMHVFHVPFSSLISYFQSPAVFMFSP